MATFRTTVSVNNLVDMTNGYRQLPYEPVTANTKGIRLPFGERDGNRGDGGDAGTGCYGIIYLRFAFNVTVEIYDTPQGSHLGKLTCAFPSGSGPAYSVLHHNETAYNPVDKEGIGGGFWNAVGFRFGSHSGTNVSRYIGTADQDSQANAVADLNSYLSTSDTAHICRYYFCDKVNDGSALANISVIPDETQGRSWSRYLDASDFNSDGSLKTLVLAQLYNRWFDQPTGYARVGGSAITLDGKVPINWLYYPWAIRSGEKWLSCNRDYNVHESPERTAYLRIKEDGDWRDVLNNLQGSTPMDGLIKDGTWVRAALYGENS